MTRPQFLRQDPVPEAESTLDPEDLAHLNLLRGVDLGSVEGILHDCPVQEYRAGETVLAAGARQQALYLVLSGRLAACAHAGQPAYAIEKGECVGELGILDRGPAPCVVIAERDTRLLVLDESAFLLLVNASHGAASNFILLLTQRLRRTARPEEHKRLQRQYQRLAVLDHQTGLFNRRWLDEQLGRYITRSAMSHDPLSLIILTVDDLATFTERFGGEARTLAVRTLADVMSRNVRPTDLIARFGNDQFVVVLPDTDLDAARFAAERLRTAVEHTEPMLSPGRALPALTASLGLAQLRSFATTDAFLSSAAAASARARENGGNCIAV